MQKIASLVLFAGALLYFARYMPRFPGLVRNFTSGWGESDSTIFGGLSQFIGHLAVVLAVVVSMLGTEKVGRRVASFSGAESRWPLSSMVYLGLGMIAVFTAWLGLGLLGLAFSSISFITVAGFSLAGIIYVRKEGVPGAGWTLFAALSLFMLIPALSPEKEIDSLIYHLALPSGYAEMHKIYAQTGLTHSGLAQGQEMFGLICLLLGSEHAAKLVSWVAAVFAALCAGELALRWLPASQARLASLLARSRGGGVNALIAGLLVGGACAVKYTAVMMIPGLLMSYYFMEQRRIKSAILALSGASIMAIPWLARNWIDLANPFFPALMNVLPSPWWGGVNHELAKYDLAQWMESPSANPVGWIMGILKSISTFSIIVAAGLPLTIIVFQYYRGARWIFFVSLSFICCWLILLPWLPRYLIIAVVPFTVASLVAWNSVWGDARGLLSTNALCFLGAALGIVAGFAGEAWRGFPILHAFGMESNDHYARRIRGNYCDAMNKLGSIVKKGEKILVIGDWRHYPNSSAMICGSASGTPQIWAMARESGDVAVLMKKLRQMNIRYVLYNLPQVSYYAPMLSRFRWSSKAANIYAKYWDSYATLVWHSYIHDPVNGYFLLYGLQPDVTKAPFRAWLPGTEGEYSELRMMLCDGVLGGILLKEVNRLELIFGGRADFLSRMAIVHVQLGDYGKVWGDYVGVSLAAPEAGQIYRVWNARVAPRDLPPHVSKESFVMKEIRERGIDISIYLNLGMPVLCFEQK